MQDQLLTQLGAALVNGSLTDDALLAETDPQPALTILPDANVVKIGGQSVIDRGQAAVYPLLDEVVANLPQHQMIIGTGAGARARHAYSVGVDLGMPTGVLSVLGTFVSMQNARMLHYLLAKHGIPFVSPIEFAQLPFYLEERQARDLLRHAALHLLAAEPRRGADPTEPHRYRRLPGERGLRRPLDDLRQGRGRSLHRRSQERSERRFIPEITVEELEALDLVDVVVEHNVLAFMKNAKHRRSIQIINGLKPGNLTRALNGEHVGTIITA